MKEFHITILILFLTRLISLSDADNKLKVVKTPNAVNPLVLGSFVSFFNHELEYRVSLD